MTKKLLFVTTILLVAGLGLWAADVTGKWTFEQEGRNGTQTVTMDLKASGSTLTGLPSSAKIAFARAGTTAAQGRHA